MQAILSKYLCATNFKGSRIKASCERGSITVSYDPALDSEANHVAAVAALVAKFVKQDASRYGTERNPWNRARAAGTLSGGDMVHVF